MQEKIGIQAQRLAHSLANKSDCVRDDWASVIPVGTSGYEL
jgi:hypothetical protein